MKEEGDVKKKKKKRERQTDRQTDRQTEERVSWFLDFNVPVTCTGSAQDEMNKQKTGTKKVNKQQRTLLQRQQKTGEERRKKKNERKRKKRGGGSEIRQTYKYILQDTKTEEATQAYIKTRYVRNHYSGVATCMLSAILPTQPTTHQHT